MSHKVYRFKQLKQSTAKEQEEKFKDITTKDVVNYLIYVGLDFKGQIQMASVAKGVGGSADVSVDPLSLVGLNTEIGVGGSLKSAKQRTIIVSRGPAKVSIGKWKGIPIPQPILVNSLIGKYWEGKGQLSIDVSVGAKAVAGVGPGTNGTAPYAKPKHSFTDEFGENKPKLTGFEAVGIALSATAGFKASGGYTYDHFYGEDLYPLSYAKQETAKQKIGVILKEGSTKTMFKRDACEFINDNVIYFGNKKMNLHGKVLWHTTTKGYKDIIQRLKKYADKAPKEVKKEAYVHIKKLESFGEKGDGTCFLRLSSHQKEGQAGIYAKAGLSASAAGLASLGVSAEAFAGISGQSKKAKARYQSRVLTMPYIVPVNGRGEWRLDTILTTYDSEITYSMFHLGATTKLEGSINVIGKQKSGKKSNEPTLSQIRYKTAIATWVKPSSVTGLKSKEITKSQVGTLAGTGVVYGQSFLVGNLKEFIENHYDQDNNKWDKDAKEDFYLKIIAKALLIKDVEKVLEFLNDSWVREMITENLPLDMGVLLEATYRMNELPKLDINMTLDPDTKKMLVQLSNDFGKKLFQKKPKILESIRLRYRKRDKDNNDSTFFTVGFKIQGTGAKIRLESVDRAGTDGIVDVATVFVEDKLKNIASQNPASAYEKAVPPAALFFQ